MSAPPEKEFRRKTQARLLSAADPQKVDKARFYLERAGHDYLAE
jgi:hypothetical protein